MKIKLKLYLILLSILVISCEKENPNVANPIQKERLDGFVQKGPYINGTSITLSELSADLIQTGKSFSSQISDNQGSFNLQQLDLSSQFVELKADGFYYNEVSGVMSEAQLTLYGLSDLTDKSSLNVNIISHLEADRVEYLISSEGYYFDEAKRKALQEIIDIFSITGSNMAESELLDISKGGDDNAILLAISAIVQGFRSEASLTELLANISTDIRTDGTLNSKEIGAGLINHASLLNLENIRENLKNRYAEMGVEANIPEFEKYVQMFIENTNFEITGLIEYPELSEYGENILFGDKSSFKTFINYSLAADLPQGANLKVILSGGLWYYQTLPNGPVNWNVAEYDSEALTQEFTSKEPGELCDLKIQFHLAGGSTRDTITIDYYENLSALPTRTKKIIIEEIE